jgi:hypothetical protein
LREALPGFAEVTHLFPIRVTDIALKENVFRIPPKNPPAYDFTIPGLIEVPDLMPFSVLTLEQGKQMVVPVTVSNRADVPIDFKLG